MAITITMAIATPISQLVIYSHTCTVFITRIWNSLAVNSSFVEPLHSKLHNADNPCMHALSILIVTPCSLWLMYFRLAIARLNYLYILECLNHLDTIHVYLDAFYVYLNTFHFKLFNWLNIKQYSVMVRLGKLFPGDVTTTFLTCFVVASI